MAGEKKGGDKKGGGDFHEKANDKATEVLFILLVLFLLFSSFMAFFSGRSFKSFVGKVLPTASSFSRVDTPIGEEVRTKTEAVVYGEPGGEAIGTQRAGARGIVTGGPEFIDGKRYWYVDFASGPDGWVEESALSKASGGAFDPGDTPIGSEISLGGEEGTRVFAEPGGAVLGTQKDGAEGTITKGPIFANGERYWYVDYKSGPDGWVAESSLGGDAGRQAREVETPIGSRAQTAESTNVLGTPGGSSVGTQPAGAQGTITKGPEYFDGKKYWYVDFASGSDGWVGEETLRNGSGGAFNPGDSPVGSDIVSPNRTEILGEPGGRQIGTQPAGARGVVAKGPEYVDGERYWYVDYESGPDGWVSEKDLRNKNGGAFDPGSSLVGAQTEAKGGIPVFSSPGGAVIGIQPKTAKGAITRGPEYVDGERYWYVDFASAPDGWVNEKNLRDEKGGKFDAGSTPVGSQVYATKDVTDIFDMAGGRRIGSQPRGAQGIISRGPVYVNGERYWYVDFASGPDGWVRESDLMLPSATTFVSKLGSFLLFFYKIIVAILCILFLTGAIYAVVRTSQIVAERSRAMKDFEKHKTVEDIHKEYANKRWEKVMVHIQSENPAEWRLAVLEADIMLSEILDRMGYVGENVGEKLKSVEKSDFLTIEDAWEAHKVRNLIAHEGSDYILTQREAYRIVSMYARVFKEFHYI